MTSLAELCSRIEAPDAHAAAEAQRRLDRKTKPRGSLGRLEELACQIAAIRRTPMPELPSNPAMAVGSSGGERRHRGRKQPSAQALWGGGRARSGSAHRFNAGPLTSNEGSAHAH